MANPNFYIPRLRYEDGREDLYTGYDLASHILDTSFSGFLILEDSEVQYKNGLRHGQHTYLSETSPYHWWSYKGQDLLNGKVQFDQLERADLEKAIKEGL